LLIGVTETGRALTRQHADDRELSSGDPDRFAEQCLAACNAELWQHVGADDGNALASDVLRRGEHAAVRHRESAHAKEVGSGPGHLNVRVAILPYDLQRPVLLDRRYCKANQRRRVRQMLDWLLIDETRHIAYTARLIERAAQASGPDHVMDLMRERVKDFNEITEEEVAQRTLAAA